MMEIGELRDVVTILLPTVVVDPIGGQTEGTPTTIAADLPAAVDSLGIGKERIQVAQLRSSVSTRVRIWWRDDITAAMHVLWRTKTLEIGAVEEHLPDELWLYCAEVNP